MMTTFLQFLILTFVFSCHASSATAAPAVLVVFAKDISDQDAQNAMFTYGLKHRPGSDSTIGKMLFYSTGPKFIVEDDKEKTDAFLKACANDKKIEICREADFTLTKD